MAITSIEYTFFVLLQGNSTTAHCHLPQRYPSLVGGVNKKEKEEHCSKTTTTTTTTTSSNKQHRSRTLLRRRRRTSSSSSSSSPKNSMAKKTSAANCTKLVVFYTEDIVEDDSQHIGVAERTIKERIDTYNNILRKQGVQSRKAYVELVLMWRLLPYEYEEWIGSQRDAMARQKFYQKMNSSRELVDADLMMIVHNWRRSSSKQDRMIKLKNLTIHDMSSAISTTRNQEVNKALDESPAEYYDWNELLANNFVLKARRGNVVPFCKHGSQKQELRENKQKRSYDPNQKKRNCIIRSVHSSFTPIRRFVRLR